MLKLTPGEWIALGGLVLASFTSAIGGLLWYANSEKKKYGLERDFNHLKNNQKQISQGITDGFDDCQERFDQLEKELTEIKAWMIRGLPKE